MNKLNILENKILTVEEVKKKINIWRLKGDKIVFTNGCFDIIHPGHIVLLTGAANYGNRLIVGLNADLSVKKLKGETRPVNNEEARALVLASLGMVDAVCFFEEDTPLTLIKDLQPDVLVKGGDYKAESIVGAKEVIENGGEVIIIPTLVGFSTSGIIEKVSG
jgi:rfaE bifunctional protein nucleotidyltransferase chain/domain